MKKQLKTNGNSWVLYINKSLATLIGVTNDSCKVDIEIINRVLYLSKNTPKTSLEQYYLSKNLIKRGAGYGFILSKPILALLEIDPEKDMVDVDINENKLSIKKA